MVRNPQKTRQRLLRIAFEEIHKHGFQGMRIDEILRRTGLQKGAFYHHFRSKIELGYAVLEEQIQPMMNTIWLEPLENIQNPLTEFPDILTKLINTIPASMRKHGCPLNNLAQEMASQDKGFQERIATFFNNWINAYALIFEKAQANGYVRNDVNAVEVARFVVATLEGCIGVFKAEQSPQQWQACQSQIKIYLEGLKA